MVSTTDVSTTTTLSSSIPNDANARAAKRITDNTENMSLLSLSRNMKIALNAPVASIKRR